MRISDWSSDVCSSDLLLAGPALAIVSGEVALDRTWYTASRASAGIVPPAAATPEAVVQVYAARAFDWRGAFAVHTWIAVSRKMPATTSPRSEEHTSELQSLMRLSYAVLCLQKKKETH